MKEAIYQAANFIERNPERYAFMCNDYPGQTGCMLGWIGWFLNVQPDANATSYPTVVARALGFRGMGDFFEALSTHLPVGTRHRLDPFNEPQEAALVLRAYASSIPDVVLPESVLAMFRTGETA